MLLLYTKYGSQQLRNSELASQNQIFGICGTAIALHINRTAVSND